MEKILQHIVPDNQKIIKYGQVNDKVLLELKMITSLYEYIRIITNYYDDDQQPYQNNWTDIEGMGYGWAWMRFEEKDWHKMMGMLVSDEADTLLRSMEDTLYFVYEDEKVKTYHFVTLDDYRTDVVVSFSNEELDW